MKVSGRTNLVVWLALVVLTAISYGVSRLHLGGGMDVFFALVIATLKTFLVVWFFMHVVEEHFAVRAAIGLAVILFLTFVLITAADPFTRKTFPPALSPPVAEPLNP